MDDNSILGFIGVIGTIVTVVSLVFLYVRTLVGGISVVEFTGEAVRYVVPSPAEIIVDIVVAFAVALIGVILGIIATLRR